MHNPVSRPVLFLGGFLGMTLLLSSGAARAQNTLPPSPPVAANKPAGGFAPGVDANAFWDGRKMVPFRALDNPKMVRADEADFLEPDDYVLGVTVNGQSRAYPTRFVWWHHVVNDKVSTPDKADAFFAVTYCSVCNTGVRYDLTLDNKPVHLDFYGLYNGVVALCDRDTESVFLQGSGLFANGPLAGKELKIGPLLDTTWAEWRKLHPETQVMFPDPAYSKFYNPKGHAEPRGYTKFPMPFFAQTVARRDNRLTPFDKVLGVTLSPKNADGKETNAPPLRRAYPVKSVQEAGNVVNDTVGSTAIAVLLNPETLAASAVSRRLDGKVLTFEARKKDGDSVAFYDKETGTRWSIEGVGMEGMLAGKTLERLNNHLSQWYGWYAYFPDTTIYGRSDAPQPGELFGASPVTKPAPQEPKP